MSETATVVSGLQFLREREVQSLSSTTRTYVCGGGVYISPNIDLIGILQGELKPFYTPSTLLP